MESNNKKKRRVDVWDIVFLVVGYMLADWGAGKIFPDNRILNLVVFIVVIGVVYIAYALVRYTLFDRDKLE